MYSRNIKRIELKRRILSKPQPQTNTLPLDSAVRDNLAELENENIQSVDIDYAPDLACLPFAKTYDIKNYQTKIGNAHVKHAFTYFYILEYNAS